MKYSLDLTTLSITGLWVGDCIGSMGHLCYIHDILNQLLTVDDKKNINTYKFLSSDDTEEAIVLVNHLNNNGSIIQDKYAYELSKRYFERDPDGTKYGYGLKTRNVLKEIYHGKSWRDANNINSCGNGSAMRVAPLGAFIYENSNCWENPIQHLIQESTLQAEVTHAHPEGIAGSIAVSLFSYYISQFANNYDSIKQISPLEFYKYILKYTPPGEVYNNILKAAGLSFDLPQMEVINRIGNGKYVTCQDTVPVCIYLIIKGLFKYSKDDCYKNVIIEANQYGGDMDTNGAIIGGILGIVSNPPIQWISYCQPMEGLLNNSLPETINNNKKINYDKKLIKSLLFGNNK